MNFEEYLLSKKIDSEAFRAAEPALWQSWKNEFEQIHPNSFTLQKLNLINPVRRKYLLKTPDLSPRFQVPSTKTQAPGATDPESQKSVSKPAMPKPVFRPKPKT